MVLLSHDHLERFCCRGWTFPNPAICQCGITGDEAGSEAHRNPSQKIQISEGCFPSRVTSYGSNQPGQSSRGPRPRTTLARRCCRDFMFPEEGRHHPSTLCLVLEEKDTVPALHPNYFSNYIELISKKMSCHGSGLCIS